MEIDTNNPTLTHILGYIRSKQWVDAIKNYNLNNDLIWELIEKQDKAYKFDLYGEVKEDLEYKNE